LLQVGALLLAIAVGHLKGKVLLLVAGAVAALSEEARGALAREVRLALQAYADEEDIAVPDAINIAMGRKP
jgi:hypothetical protein